MRKAMRPSSHRSVGGFTLLEVLVALTILAVALTAALRSAMALTNNIRDIRAKQYALMTAENRLLELQLGAGAIQIGVSGFPCEQGGVVFSCEQIIRPTPNPFVDRVEVAVRSSDGAREFADLMALLPAR